MRVYSPSQTDQFLACPVWWSLSRDWQRRIVPGYRDLAGILGRAYAAGLAVYHGQRQPAEHGLDQPLGADAAVAAALRVVTADMAALEGRVLTDRDQQQAALLPSRAEKAVVQTIAAAVIPSDWLVKAVEEDLGAEYGYATPDLVVEDPRGVAPLDYKLKLAIRGRSPMDREWNKAAMVADYELSWQLYHYCWALKANHYYVALAVLEPRFSIELLPFEIHPETMALWQGFAHATWARMEAAEEGTLTLTTRMPCRNQYGLCDCNDAVWKHHLDPALMEEDYVRIPRVSR